METSDTKKDGGTGTPGPEASGVTQEKKHSIQRVALVALDIVSALSQEAEKAKRDGRCTHPGPDLKYRYTAARLQELGLDFDTISAAVWLINDIVDLRRPAMSVSKQKNGKILVHAENTLWPTLNSVSWSKLRDVTFLDLLQKLTAIGLLPEGHGQSVAAAKPSGAAR